MQHEVFRDSPEWCPCYAYNAVGDVHLWLEWGHVHGRAAEQQGVTRATAVAQPLRHQSAVRGDGVYPSTQLAPKSPWRRNSASVARGDGRSRPSSTRASGTKFVTCATSSAAKGYRRGITHSDPKRTRNC
jgi:hypothetical protein